MSAGAAKAWPEAEAALAQLDVARYHWLRANFARIVVLTEPAFSILGQEVRRIESIEVRPHFSPCEPASVDAAVDAAMRLHPLT